MKIDPPGTNNPDDFVPFGKKHPVCMLMEFMKVSDELRVKKAEFNWKNRTPAYFAHKLESEQNKKFIVHKLKDGSGWVVVRVE